MKTKYTPVHLRMADIPFRISADPGIHLQMCARHKNFLCGVGDLALKRERLIPIHYSHQFPEPNTGPIGIWEAGDSHYQWKVFRYFEETVIYIYFPNQKYPSIVSLNPQYPDKPIRINPGSDHPNILRYPLDLMILQFLSRHFKLLMVHGSGFILDNNGFLCLGKSGAGKTTLARLAKASGGQSIQDDRLFIRQVGNQWRMYPVPLSHADRPTESGIDQLISLHHGQKNHIQPLLGLTRTGYFLPHTIHFPRNKENYFYQLRLCENLLNAKPFNKFMFTPDETAIPFLKQASGRISSHPEIVAKKSSGLSDNERK